ncbi:hypothetical protein RDI58_022440 [Solanum bulbocastanum]|uniref:Uncharacterized protein n=1 Tax=Solanum bulbocastanum TaxID=147425 RepID=A0AAN8T7S7_SOLBU
MMNPLPCWLNRNKYKSPLLLILDSILLFSPLVSPNHSSCPKSLLIITTSFVLYCKTNHSIEKCYRLNYYPYHLKFTKNTGDPKNTGPRKTATYAEFETSGPGHTGAQS